MSRLPFGLPVWLSRSLSFTDSALLKNSHIHTHTCFSLFSLNHSGWTVDLEEALSFWPRQYFCSTGDFDSEGFFVPPLMHCRHSFLPHCSASLPLFKETVTQTAIYCSKCNTAPLLSLYPSTLQTSKQFRFLEKGRSWFEMLNGGCFSFCFMQLYSDW